MTKVCIYYRLNVANLLLITHFKVCYAALLLMGVSAYKNESNDMACLADIDM
jgi:hypothetical protein